MIGNAILEVYGHTEYSILSNHSSEKRGKCNLTYNYYPKLVQVYSLIYHGLAIRINDSLDIFGNRNYRSNHFGTEKLMNSYMWSPVKLQRTDTYGEEERHMSLEGRGPTSDS